MGAPSFLLPFVILLEVIGGVAIVVGWQTRWIALALAGFCILSALIFHSNFTDQNEMANFMKKMSYWIFYCLLMGQLVLDRETSSNNRTFS